MATRELRVEIIGDASSLQRALGQANKSSTGLSRGMNILKGASLGLAGVAAGALVVGLKRGWTEMQESQKVAAQTAAALKSTGGAANVTAGNVGDLATALSKMSGIDDEAVQSSENLLLTFTNIRNEVGKGNDIFNQATKSVLDMSVALDQDLSSSSIQLGKALNDPIKGITALRRVGVAFTEGQTTMIKSMVEAGDTIGAQKLILAELTKEFGGSAKAAGDTLPGQINKMKNAFDEAAGNLITKLLPTLTRFVNYLVENGPAMQQALQGVADSLKPLIQAFQAIMPVVEPVFKLLLSMGVAAFENMLTPINIIVKLLQGDWAGAWDAAKVPVQNFLDIAGKIVVMLQPVIDFFTTTIPNAITGALTSAFTAASGFGAQLLAGLTSGVTGLAAAAVSKFAQIITDIGAKLQGAFTAAANFGAKLLAGLGSGVVGLVTEALGKFTDIITGIGAKLQNAFNAASDFGAKILAGVKAGVVGLALWVGGVIQDGINAITSLLGAAKTAAGNIGLAIFNGISGKLSGMGKALAGGLRDALNVLIGAWNAIAINVPGFSINLPFVGDVGWPAFTVDFPDIPTLAMGGIVTRPTLAMIGEAGPEAVVPLSRAGGMAGGGVIHNHIYLDGRQIAESVTKHQFTTRRYGGELPASA